MESDTGVPRPQADGDEGDGEEGTQLTFLEFPTVQGTELVFHSDTAEGEHSEIQCDVDGSGEPDLAKSGTDASADGEGMQENEDEQDAEEEDEDVRTFMEFTGSTDRERAREYLTATEGNLEEAVNLFLSGAPPPAPAPSSGSVRQESGSSGALGGAVEVGLPHLLAHLEALASGSARHGGSGGGDEDDSHSQMDALLSDLTEHDVNLSALARSLMSGAGFSDFVRLTTQSSSPSSESNANDEELYEANSTTVAEAKNRLENLARGQPEAISVVGAHITRSVSSCTTYLEAGLIPSLSSALGRISTEGAIRVLQVFEAAILMLCRGLDETERMTVGWFIPPRRSGGSARRGRPKSWVLDTFQKDIAPNGDLPSLRRLWRRREIDPTMKTADGNNLLAVATSVRAPLVFLRFLVFHWGCDPSEASGPLGSAATIASSIFDTSIAEGQKDEWAAEVARLFSEQFAPLDEKIREERRLAPYHLPSADFLPTNLCSDYQWLELTHALLRYISRSSNVSAARRALEVLVLIVSESVTRAPLTHPGLVGLISSGLANECKDSVVIHSALRILDALAKAEGTESSLINLARVGAIHRLSRRSFEAAENAILAKDIIERVSNRIKAKFDLEGRPQRILDAVKSLNNQSEDAIPLLAFALSDITTFEFEQSKLAETVHNYFSNRAVPAHSLLHPVDVQPKSRRGSSMEDIPSSTSDFSADDMHFSFAASSHGLRYRRTGSQSARSGGGEHWKSVENSTKTRKLTILDKLVECAQAVLSESVPVSFPQIVHDFPGKEEGVRALLNALPLRLCASSSLKELLADRVSEFSMPTLPLTSKREIEKQVLRSGAILNRRYLDYCKDLIGKKVALTLADGSTELHVCTAFDFKHGAHRLKSLASSQQHWRIMSASKYAVLERVFDADDSAEITANDETDHECPAGGAFLSGEIPAQFGKDDSMLASEDAVFKLDDSSKPSQGSPVAVWWEGSADLRPGWRLGVVLSDLDQDLAQVLFPAEGLFFDDDIRVGSIVRLIGGDGLSSDLIPHVGETARVTSMQGMQVSTNGFGGHSCNISFLTKIRDVESDGRKPQVGDNVGLVSLDGTKFERGVLLSDDGSKVPFTIKKSENGEIVKCREKDVFLLVENPSTMTIPSRRLIPVQTMARVNQEHAFAVYIRPGSVANDVPDFGQVSAAQPPNQVFYTITSEQEPLSGLVAASSGWGSGEDVEENENQERSMESSTSVAPRLTLGARIEGRYAGKSRWYKGHISRVNADGTYDLAYDDGDTERCVPPSFVAAVTSTESGSEEPSARPSVTPTGVMLDFRKVFPTHAGRALFDALRREDHVLRAEYNFVTRGFEHQPNFYNSFATSLEHVGAGVFAQFQTYQQAETLFERCAKFARDIEGGNDKIFIRYEPDRRAHPNVLREILSAFTKVETQRTQSASASSPFATSSMHLPPKPGSRALLRVGSDAKTRALVEASKTSAWVPATVLACPVDGQVMAVCTDDGMFFRRVPADQLKDAPTRAAHPQQPQQPQPPSRRLTFRTGGRGTSGANAPSPTAPRLDTPIELTRQFSVFGNSNALRHINIGERSPSSTSESRPLQAQSSPPVFALSSPALTASSAPSPLLSPLVSSLPSRPETQPPKIIVTFDPAFSPQNRAIALLDEDDAMNDDMCVFRLIFETLFNDKKYLSKSNVLKAKWNLVSGIRLTWKTKVVFAGESQQASASSPSSPAAASSSEKGFSVGGEEKFKATTKDAFQLLITLFKRSHGNATVDWVNPTLSAHFRNQLRDPLGVATRVLPRWVQSIPAKAFFLFSERDRTAYLRGCTLGVSRSIAWLQEEVTGYQAKKRELAQLTVEISQLFNQAEPNEVKYKRLSQSFEKLDDEVKQIKENKFIGQLRQDLVKVDGTNLLKDAMALMENHAGERSELVVQFVGDTGAGEGVTHEFYGAVAAELQKVEQNRQVPMWADPSKAVRTSEQTDLIRPLGLFPQPLLASRSNKRASDLNQAVLDRFRFLGRLMGQALLDEKTVPIPLAVEFFELLKEDEGFSVTLPGKRTSTTSPGQQQQSSGKKSRVPNARIIRLIESGDHSFVSDTGGNAASEEAGGDDIEDEVALVDDDGSSSGIVSTLSRLVHIIDDPSCSQRMKDAALQSLESRLDELGLRFVDPSQPFLTPQTSAPAISNEAADEISAALVAENSGISCGLETEIFGDVPLAEAPYPAVLAFANEWSKKGKTKAQIDRALEQTGHSKIARWRVLQATQATRVQTSTSFKDEDRFDSATELIPEGRKVIVDVKNVREYLIAVEKHWTGPGLRPQIQAVRVGLADALGELGSSTMIKLFPAEALVRMFCGEQEVKWNDNDPLLGFLLPKGEYNLGSKEIRMLVECLKKMTQTERSQFLSFCTALPRVPSSGLPQIKIFPPTKSRVTALVLSDVDSAGAPSNRRDRLQVGDRVKLAPGYENVEDAAHGPLHPGEIGEVSNVILRAKVKDWWYHPRALVKVPEGEAQQGDKSPRVDGTEANDEDDDEQDEEDEEVDEQEEEDPEEGRAEDDEGHHEETSGGDFSEASTTATAAGATSTDDTPVSAGTDAAAVMTAKRQWFEEGDVVRTAEARGMVSAWDVTTNTLHLQEATANRDFRSGRRLTVTKKNASVPVPVGMPTSFSIRNVVEQCEVVQSPPFLRPKATTCVMALYLPTGYEDSDHMLQVFREAFEDAKLGGLQDA